MIGVLCEFDKSVDEAHFDFVQLSAVVAVAESIQLPDRFPHLRVQHVFHTVFCPAWGIRYLPLMSFEMSAHLLPYRT